MSFDVVIRGGRVVTSDGIFESDVGVIGERIAALGSDLSGSRTIDASGCLVIPGGVDPHVHLEYPVAGLRSADDYFTGTRAAALGGTTTVIDFVEAKEDQRLVDGLADRRRPADEKAVIDFGFHMTIKPEDLEKLDQVEEAVAAGCPTFKHYMAYAFCLNDGQLLRSFKAIARAGGLAIVHAENWDVIQALIAENLANGRTGPHWHPRSRPRRFEGQAAGRAIDLAEEAGLPLYIFHISCPEVVTQMAAARARGAQVWGETCPQYLVLDCSLFDRPGAAGALPVCAPPIREKAVQEPLWSALAIGEIQAVSTDHCPFTVAEKAANLDNFSKIPGGVPSIESRLTLIYSHGVSTGKLSLSQWVDRCCTAPAKLMGLPSKGRIAIGCDADLVVFDPAIERTLSVETLHENVDWSPYEGMAVHGVCRDVLSRGEVIVEDRNFVGQAGRGRFQRRALESAGQVIRDFVQT
jgi:dihydropyrimidinase